MAKEPNTSCLQCGVPMYVPKWRSDSSRGKFCSRRCHADWRSEQPKSNGSVENICPTCGCIFYSFPSHHRVYCSRGCFPYSEHAKNIPMTDERRRKIGDANKGNRVNIGSDSHLWKGGITPLNMAVRSLINYRQWRSDVFTRDDFTCRECGIRGGDLNAHHINSFSNIMETNNIQTIEEAVECEELWNINNGITLCRECHCRTDNYGNKKR